MSNRIYQIDEDISGASQEIKQNIYVDLDSTAIYSGGIAKNDRLNIIIGFIKFIINKAGLSVDDMSTQISTLASALLNCSIADMITQLITAFSGIGYTYDELVGFYNEYIGERDLIMKRLLDANAVKNSIKQIFTWIPGERVLNPEFGSRIRVYLYEQITDANHEKIISEIRGCISKWEPRVQIVDIRRLTSDADREMNTVHVEVQYKILGLDDAVYSYVYTQDIFER